jgi:hypothetical protein
MITQNLNLFLGVDFQGLNVGVGFGRRLVSGCGPCASSTKRMLSLSLNQKKTEPEELHTTNKRAYHCKLLFGKCPKFQILCFDRSIKVSHCKKGEKKTLR